MIEINIDPILYLGSLEVRWLTITTMLSFIIVIVVGIAEARHYHVGKHTIIGLILSFLIGSLIGGKLSFILYSWRYLSTHPEQIVLTLTVKIYGVLLGALVAIAIYNKLFQTKLSFWQIGDITAPGAMLGMAVYRFGCIINGCCDGIQTDVPWAVVYTNPSSVAPFGKLLHPTQMYHLLLGLIAFTVIWFLRHRLKPEGSLFLLWLILFAATDLPVRFFRVEEPFLLDLNLAVIIDSIILVITVPWLILRIRSTSIGDDTAPLHPRVHRP